MICTHFLQPGNACRASLSLPFLRLHPWAHHLNFDVYEWKILRTKAGGFRKKDEGTKEQANADV
jgi:hypothetical protein